MSGRGKIVTFTVIRYPPEGFEKDAPYMVAIIQLDGGPRVLGRVAARIDELQIAATVEFVKNTGGSLLFRAS